MANRQQQQQQQQRNIEEQIGRQCVQSSLSEYVVAPSEPFGLILELGRCLPHFEALAVFFGSRTAWMLGSTPP